MKGFLHTFFFFYKSFGHTTWPASESAVSGLTSMDPVLLLTDQRPVHSGKERRKKKNLP
jgi:hypothetical protein